MTTTPPPPPAAPGPDRTFNTDRSHGDGRTAGARHAAESTHSSATDLSAAPDRGVLMDLIGFVPAPTLGRELFALVVNLVAVGILIAVVRPSLPIAALVLGIVALFMLIRLAVGFTTRGYVAALKGES